MRNHEPRHSQKTRRSNCIVQSAVVSWTACAGRGAAPRNSDRLRSRTHAFRGIRDALYSVVQPGRIPPSVQQASKCKDDGDHHSTPSVVQRLCVWSAGCRPLETWNERGDESIQQQKQGHDDNVMRFLRNADSSCIDGLCIHRCASGDTRVNITTLLTTTGRPGR